MDSAGGGTSTLLLLLAGISSTTWSYDGMQVSGTMGGEIKNPRRNLPITMLSTAIFITLLYTFLSTITVGLLPAEQLAQSSAPVAEAAAQIPIIGERAGLLAAILAIVVIIGSVSSLIMFQPRMNYQMGHQGMWFESWGKVHPKWKTPYVSMLWQSGVAIIFIWISQINDLLGYFTVAALLHNVFAFIAIFKLRKMPDYNPSYKTPFWRLTAMLALVPTIILLISTFVWSPLGSFVATALAVLTAIPVYRYFAVKNNIIPHTGLDKVSNNVDSEVETTIGLERK